MVYALYIVFFISCVVLIASVLLQPGKTDAGALFTSNVSSAAFGPRGTASVLSKLTIAASIIFMLSALLISMPALTGNISVLNAAGTPAEAPAGQTAADQQTVPANTQTATDNSNSGLVETPATNSFESQANVATNTAPAGANAPANK